MPDYVGYWTQHQTTEIRFSRFSFKLLTGECIRYKENNEADSCEDSISKCMLKSASLRLNSRWKNYHLSISTKWCHQKWAYLATEYLQLEVTKLRKDKTNTTRTKDNIPVPLHKEPTLWTTPHNWIKQTWKEIKQQKKNQTII